jgi:hypothetical protein
MKKFFISIIVFLFCFSLTFAQTWVNGYYKKDGTYVPGHFRSNSNNTSFDNYSTKGNINPFTGEKGYKDPYGSSNSFKSFDFNNNDFNLNNNSIWNNDVKVKSYFRDDGTNVESYYRTKPNNSMWDNYSTEGNNNPYTGKEGNKKIK